ncbi:hypothetical protein [Actinophytocola sp. NPDC049390]|uniref:hypothetical protein n=1 Tax=Actinophytocola sp. NPDC049390 TaxID=3363894 RepID=UPI0037983F29
MSHPNPEIPPPYVPVPPRPRRSRVPLAAIGVVAVVVAAAAVIVVLVGGADKPAATGDSPEAFAATRDTETTTTTTTTYTRTPYVPKPEDFELEVQVLEQQCYGSAGCNVTFRISVAYNGDTIYDGDGPYTVVYSLTGTDDPFVSRFTLLSQYEYSATEEMVSTPPGAKLKAAVTQVF